jgi:iron complex outermembrane recepter protein
MIARIPCSRAVALVLATLASSASLAEMSAKPTVEEVIVTGYRPGDATSSSKTDVSALENPQAISVVTADLMQDQGITRLADALRNVSGISRSSTYGFFDSYQIRGYDAAYGSIFLDGLKNGNVAGEVNELGGLEQIEVVKGPASGLFGASPLGGVVNLVSKRPKETSFVNVALTTGSYDAIESAVDANAPLTETGSLLGRLNVIYKDREEFVDFSSSERIYVAPALTWRPTDAMELTLLTRYQRDELSPWSPVTAWGTILPNPNGELPVSFAVNDDDQRARYDQESKQAGYEFVYRFSDALRLTQNLRYEETEDSWNQWMFAAGISEDLTTIGRYFYGPFDQTTRDLGVDTRLNAEFSTGAVRHKVLTGIDYVRSKNHSLQTGLYDGLQNPLSLFPPDYSAPLVPASDPLFEGSGRSAQLGFYVQDHLNFGERLTVTLGGRWDEVETDDQKDRAFSPTVGATWALSPSVSLYANAAESFTPTPSWQTRADGSLLPPETGENIETGIKFANAERGLAGMVSIFQLTRKNVATEDPDNMFFYIVTGEQRSRGVEVETAWTPSDAIDVRLAYTWIEAEITKDNTYPVGLRLPNVPRNNVSVWGKYTVPSGPLANLGMSLGLVYNGDKQFYEGEVYQLSGYTLVDAGLSYDIAGWTTQLTLNNLFDERYFPDACCLDRVTPGEPRNWQLRVQKSW